MKKTFKQSLNEAVKISKNMPRTLKEALNFEEAPANMPMEGEDMDMEDDMESSLPGANPANIDPGARSHAAKLIDSIRKQALRAMADLADDPECEEYIMLKKVWQMTDRKPEKDGEKNA